MWHMPSASGGQAQITDLASVSTEEAGSFLTRHLPNPMILPDYKRFKRFSKF
jgi:hypothetical protein